MATFCLGKRKWPNIKPFTLPRMAEMLIWGSPGGPKHTQSLDAASQSSKFLSPTDGGLGGLGFLGAVFVPVIPKRLFTLYMLALGSQL